jgi:hypothetical protein
MIVRKKKKNIIKSITKVPQPTGVTIPPKI